MFVTCDVSQVVGWPYVGSDGQFPAGSIAIQSSTLVLVGELLVPGEPQKWLGWESLRIEDSTQLCRVWGARKDGEGVRRPDSAPASRARVDYRLEN